MYTFDTVSNTNLQIKFLSLFLFIKDVSQVTDFRIMFQDASNFNTTLHSWDVSKGVSFVSMFAGATSFNQNLCQWGYKISKDKASLLWMFGATGGASACPLSQNPNMTSSPPGPFCHECTYHDGSSFGWRSSGPTSLTTLSSFLIIPISLVLMGVSRLF